MRKFLFFHETCTRFANGAAVCFSEPGQRATCGRAVCQDASECNSSQSSRLGRPSASVFPNPPAETSRCSKARGRGKQSHRRAESQWGDSSEDCEVGGQEGEQVGVLWSQWKRTRSRMVKWGEDPSIGKSSEERKKEDRT